MDVYLNVQYSNQLPAAAGGLSARDSTGCWLHCVSMVLTYFGERLRVGLPELYAPGLPASSRSAIQSALGGTALPRGHFATGSPGAQAAMNEAMRRSLQAAIGGTAPGPLPPSMAMSEHQLLAGREGMEAVPQCETGHTFLAAELVRLLRNSGPIAFYWQKTSGGSTYGHASVLIGVTDDNRRIWYHDPENAPNSRMPIDRFNSLRQQWRYAMMRRRGVTPSMVRPATPPRP